MDVPSVYDTGPGLSITDKNIVFDIDETLVHTFEDFTRLKELGIYRNPKTFDLRKRIYKMSLEDMFQKKGSGTQADLWGVTRPHLRELLVFCSTYFRNVCVWSAGQYAYVHNVSKDIFRDIKQPNVIFTWNQCVKGEGGSLEKPLANMYKMIPSMNATNTFVIDDRQSTFGKVNPGNGILIPAYAPPDTIDGISTDDPTLRQLIQFFAREDVKAAKDIRLLDKSRIFNTPLTGYVK